MERGKKPAEHGFEVIVKEFLGRLAEASYQVALKLGFRGSFVAFLADLQEAMEQVVEKDKLRPRAGVKKKGRGVFH